ncbi:Glutathione transferase [Mycena venus]|uniref:Glutathione transferase n=1 Tax=Mycena venus TaxID=2733690 RepID=A0A8H6Y680_9AGAR|nr:Glutathione transferase [Mycena venus]
MPEQKNYHLECTGTALDTVKQHSDASRHHSLWKLLLSFRSTSLGGVGYYEVDPYKKPADLLEVSPKGLVPGLKLHKYTPPRGLNESTVILEYFEDLAAKTTKGSLLPIDPYARALVRLQCDHISRSLVPAFYRFLQAQEESAQIEGGKDFHAALEALVVLFERAESEIVQSGGAAGVGEQKALAAGLGLWVEGGDLSLADAMVGPWIFRASNVLKHYRAFELPTGDKFGAWIARLFAHPAFKATCSTEELYLDSYERYAQNRPNTSQVANAINSGKPLP